MINLAPSFASSESDSRGFSPTPLSLAADELAPRHPSSPAGGPESRLAQDLADRGRRDTEPERGELALDSLVTPAGVLAREPQDEPAELTADSRAAGSPARVGPAPRHELAMPAQKRVGRDEERAPAMARDEPARSGQECSVGWSKRGASNLAAKDRELVAKHYDL